MLATFGYDFTLWGWPVWSLAGLGGALAFILSGWVPVGSRWARGIRVAAPGVMIAGLLFTRWLGGYSSPFFFYKFYHAQLDIAFLVAYGFGCGFALEALRSRDKFLRVLGIVYSVTLVGIFPLIVIYIHSMREHWYA
jgi:hypothetical protein